MDTSILNLPEEIMFKILWSLPVELLLRFKRVCKQWYFFISNKYFGENLCTNSTKVLLAIDGSSSTSDDSSSTSDGSSYTSDGSPYTSDGSPYTSERSSYTVRCCSLNSLLSEANLNPDEFKLPVKNSEDIQIVGCCNGLICILVNGSCFYLWNPSTRMIKMLPDVIGSSRYEIWRYGFGYDESNEDYKICVLFQCPYVLDKYMRVFSMKSGCWKHIRIRLWDEMNNLYGREEDRNLRPMRHAGKLLKGKIHWGIESFHTTQRIVSFDLTTEMWKTIKFPLYWGGKFSNGVEIIAGCLCILCDISGTRGDIWIMKQYGVKRSWEKLLEIPYCHDCKGPYLSPPFYILPDCRILLLRGSFLTIYDPKDKSVLDKEIASFGNIVQAHIYIENSTQIIGAQEGCEIVQFPLPREKEQHGEEFFFDNIWESTEVASK